MKKLFMLAIAAMFIVSCGVAKKSTFLETYSPEESGLNMMKITDENSNTILGSGSEVKSNIKVIGKIAVDDFAATTKGGSKKINFYWNTNRLLSISPDGSEIAYLTRKDKQDNVMIKRSMALGPSTQRTFRDVNDFFWGSDGNIYFSDCSDGNHLQIVSTNAHAGSLVRQLSSYNADKNPALTSDGTLLFFTRIDNNGPSIWSLELGTGAITSCARGYNPCPIPGKNDTFICVRNSSSGNSEIWMVNYVLGQETLLLTDKEKGYTNPSISPDGQWITFTGSSKSVVTKKINLDIYAMKIDGSNFSQITYHPGNDCCPVWSADGQYIYFISSRANKNQYYNVWRMRFTL